MIKSMLNLIKYEQKLPMLLHTVVLLNFNTNPKPWLNGNSLSGLLDFKWGCTWYSLRKGAFHFFFFRLLFSISMFSISNKFIQSFAFSNSP